jgi:tetratricopeptide (TPR) repeat protein
MRTQTQKYTLKLLLGMLGLLGTFAQAQNVTQTPSQNVTQNVTQNVMYAFSDTRILPAANELERDLEGAKSWTCHATGPAGSLQPQSIAQSIPALEVALNTARDWLAQHEAAGLRAFEASPDSRSADAAQKAALTASILGKPQAALAALLAAERLKPNDPQVRINLGGVLSHLGFFNEALAVLQTVKTHPGTAALGLSLEAIWQNNRGYAQLQLGQTSEAEQSLERAVQLAPTLSEAKLNLARAQMCLGKTAEARQTFGAGMRRTPVPNSVSGAAQKNKDPRVAEFQEIPTRDSDTSSDTAVKPDSETRRALHLVYDLSRGKSTVLPDLKIPWTPAETVALLPQYQKLSQELYTRIEALTKREAEVERLINARLEPSVQVSERRNALWSALLTSQREPRLAALERAMNASGKAPDEIWTNFWHCEGGCKSDLFMTQARSKVEMRALCIPALEADHHRFRGAMFNWATDLGAYLKASYRLQTALAANYSDPLWHERASLQAEFQATALFSSYVNMMAAWALDIKQFEDSCVQGGEAIEASSVAVAKALELPRSSICTQLLGGWSASLSVGVGSLSLSCDSISLTAATPGWIGAFGTLSHSFGTEEYTVFAGIQETASIPIPITPVGVTSQQGVYITWGDQGVVDAGLQITTSVGMGGALEEVGLSRDLLTPVTGTLSGQWSLVSSGGAKP